MNIPAVYLALMIPIQIVSWWYPGLPILVIGITALPFIKLLPIIKNCHIDNHQIGHRLPQITYQMISMMLLIIIPTLLLSIISSIFGDVETISIPIQLIISLFIRYCLYITLNTIVIANMLDLAIPTYMSSVKQSLIEFNSVIDTVEIPSINA